MRKYNLKILLIFISILSLIMGCGINKTVVTDNNEEKSIPPDKIYIEPPLELHDAKLETVIKEIFEKVKQPYESWYISRGKLDIKLERKMIFKEFIEKFSKSNYLVTFIFDENKKKYFVAYQLPSPQLSRLYKIEHIKTQELMPIIKMFLSCDGKAEEIKTSAILEKYGNEIRENEKEEIKRLGESIIVMIEEYPTKFEDIEVVISKFDVKDYNKNLFLCWNELGKEFERIGYLMNAKKSYEKGLELFPDSKELLENLKKVEEKIDSIARKEEGLYILWTDYYSE